MRKTFLFIHRWLGIVFGFFIFIVCLTGAVLTFQSEIVRWLNSDLYHVSVPAGAKHLSDKELAARVLAQLDKGQTITFIQVSDKPGETAQANIAGMGRRNLFVNPYTGEVLGYPRYTKFFDTVKSLHRWLLNKPDNPHQGSLSVGRVVVGLTAIAMSLILLTGLYLWWPKSLKMLRSRLTVSTSKGLRRFVYDSHVSLGIYACAFLLLMSLTGPTWSFTWYKSAAQTVLAKQDGQREDVQKHGEQRQGTGKESHLANEMRHGQPQANVSQRPEDVEVKRLSAGERQGGDGFRMLIASLHFGGWAGWLSKVIYLLAALIGATLPLSGFYMWWKRTHASKAHR